MASSKPNPIKTIVLTLCLSLDCALLIGCWLCYLLNKEAPYDVIYICYLLSAIWFQQLFAWYLARDIAHVALLSAIGSASYLAAASLTILFSFGIKHYILGYIAFLVSLISVALLLLICSVIELTGGVNLNDQNGETPTSKLHAALRKCKKIICDGAWQLSRKRLTLILYGLASFLSVAILLGYAWLHHDKDLRSHKSNDSYAMGLMKVIDKNLAINDKTKNTDSSLATTIWFLPGQASVYHNVQDENLIDISSDNRDLAAHNPIKTSPNPDQVRKHNTTALLLLLGKIHEIYAPNCYPFVSIVGKASDTPVSRNRGIAAPYDDNLQLSKARGERVELELISLIAARTKLINARSDSCRVAALQAAEEKKSCRR
ncbi:MAG: hypothetical protein V1797_19065 [Pseudomonadota bacterium]